MMKIAFIVNTVMQVMALAFFIVYSIKSNDNSLVSLFTMFLLQAINLSFIAIVNEVINAKEEVLSSIKKEEENA